MKTKNTRNFNKSDFTHLAVFSQIEGGRLRWRERLLAGAALVVEDWGGRDVCLQHGDELTLTIEGPFISYEQHLLADGRCVGWLLI